MKLYYAPGACSLTPHIVLHECGIAAEVEKVDLGRKLTASGKDFTAINPKGYVPALALEGGAVLTEVAAICLYLADRKPGGGLAPQMGMERYRLIEWLAFISSEIHKTLGPLWNPATPEQTQQNQRNQFARRMHQVAKSLGDKPFLMGTTFTIADAYLFNVLGWCSGLKIDLAPWPTLQAFVARVAQRPGVQAAMRAEGLLG